MMILVIVGLLLVGGIVNSTVSKFDNSHRYDCNRYCGYRRDKVSISR